ncbi:methyltransferase [Rugamonas sp. CCM 8940]|uniref:class I SAM-dependent methyltransferase n=1 Tax=Rugamonas sp. CCM 8940 TaxID=2765359 RepID=UPI0018F50574|nr:class I SAM-dependent methyltransferase [Rugamonas sp. CCM 8940]MBJ7312889.1 class I SAM-dependent methyltransferase [Rugamonas sp. CCM 8940]
MNQPSTVPAFSFDLFYNTVNAYYRSAAVKAALELGIFDVIGEQGLPIPAIADACHASERGVRILCRFLAAIGFLKMNGEVPFMTREMVMYLNRKSPGYLGGSIDFLLSPYIMNAFTDLSSVVRTGEIGLQRDGVLAADHPQWVQFARSMAPMMSLPSMLLAELVDQPPARPLRVLDVAAGHGLFGIAVARRNPLAEITFLDWDNVLDVARENASHAELGERARWLPGSAFEVDYGEGYDVILLTNFLHHFDEAGCALILRKAHAALKPDGRVYTFEFIANEDRISPPLAATFSMMMLGTTPLGEVYSFSDMQRMFGAAGYEHVELKPIPPAMEKVVVSYKTRPPR